MRTSRLQPVVFALSIMATACAHPQPTIWGLPDSDPHASLADTRHVTRERVQAIGDALAARRGGGNLEGEALTVLTDAYLALGNDPDRVPTEFDDAWLTVQRFPRLTFPALREPQDLEDAKGATHRSWLVPVIVDNRPTHLERILASLPIAPEAGARRKRREQFPTSIAFWLEHGALTEPSQRNPVALDAHRVTLPSDAKIVDRPEWKYTMPPSSFEDTLPYVFEIPYGCPQCSAPGFYNVRILPRLVDDDTTAGGEPLELTQRLAEGDWYGALPALARLPLDAAHAKEAARGLEALADSARKHPAVQFHDRLEKIRERLAECAEALRTDARDQATQPSPELLAARDQIGAAIDALLMDESSLAPVALDESHPASEPFSFVIVGDFQYHRDFTALHRFLSSVSYDASGYAPHGSNDLVASDPALAAARAAKFVVVVGDLADGAAGSAIPQLVANFFGLYPPRSPYRDTADSDGHEYQELRHQLAKLDKPVFAVPGNHDGFIGSAGVLHHLLYLFGRYLVAAPMGGIAASRDCPDVFDIADRARFLEQAARFIPTLVALRVGDGGLGISGFAPLYDGLNEWQRYLGPLHVAFRYRDRAFVGVNSYSLPSASRSQVGAVAYNWGGELQPDDVTWLDGMLSWTGKSAGRPAAVDQFLFMHHDPRGRTPTKRTFEDDPHGDYDPKSTWLGSITLGYGGLFEDANAPISISWPVLTPAFSYGVRAINNWLRDSEFQQEWMMSNPLGPDPHGTTPDVLGTIYEHLPSANAPDGQHDARGGRLTHLFFAHDDIPAQSRWLCGTLDASACRAWFSAGDGAASDSWWVKPAQFGFKISERADHLLRETTPSVDGVRDATVIRLDDVGQVGDPHGMQIVTVSAGGAAETTWVPLPR